MPFIKIVSPEEEARRIEAAVEAFRLSQYDALPFVPVSPDELWEDKKTTNEDDFRKSIDELKRRFDIIDIVERFVPLSPSGMGVCPFHSDKRASLSVHKEKQFFYCFGCTASGDVITFLMRIEHKTFREVVTDLASEAGLPVPNNFKKKR